MTAEEIIRQTKEDASEWTEMTENPDQVVIGILAQKLVNLHAYTNYLEKRLSYGEKEKGSMECIDSKKKTASI